MRLDLPPILRLLTPDERPDPPRVLVTFADPTEAQRMTELEKTLGVPPVVPFLRPDDIIVDDVAEPALSLDEQRRLTEALITAYERAKARGRELVLVMSRLEE